MLRSIVAHIYPPFIFLFWVTIFLLVSKLTFYYKPKSWHIRTDMHGTRLVISIIGGFFSIFLGFVTFISWSNYKDATGLIAQESTEIYNIWENSKAFPPSIFQNVDKLLVKYVSSLINEEWPSMAKGMSSSVTEKISNEMYTQFLHYRPSDSYIQSYYNRAVSSLHKAIETRNQRIGMLKVIIPSAWYVMILFGTLIIITVSVFLLEKNILGMCIQVMLCIFLAFYITAIILLSHPLSGLITISNEPYKTLLHKIKS
ncbi:DUF4239 domain-containing protein [Legionella israelensis]|uniref:bestrophin-like domain n=1 Tax=Legionella israelensis TaxID=454 RepID=UPI00117CE10B|nr:DUF4239 domain-containing protein [Legionella israelensis]QDP71459.1 DUF4239 domain-containing protein [Legionella israelensis]